MVQHYAGYGHEMNLVGIATESTLEGVKVISDGLDKKVRIVRVSEEQYTQLREEQHRELMGDFEERVAQIGAE